MPLDTTPLKRRTAMKVARGGEELPQRVGQGLLLAEPQAGGARTPPITQARRSGAARVGASLPQGRPTRHCCDQLLDHAGLLYRATAVRWASASTVRSANAS
jgi:hypothetical protein